MGSSDLSNVAYGDEQLYSLEESYDKTTANRYGTESYDEYD